MSMSEFERELFADDDEFSRSLNDQGLPADFSPEDIDFARELHSLFPIEQEELPPFFVQTLLEPELPRNRAASDSFEQQTYVRVCRQLRVRRPLYRSYSPLHALRQPMFSPKRSVTALLLACMAFMLVTMLATGPSFASGMKLIFSGPHSGVVQMSSLPGSSSGALPAPKQRPDFGKQDQAQKEMDLLEAQRLLRFNLHFPLSSMPDNYSISGIYLYEGSNQQWADGPIVELQYSYRLPGVATHGSGRITITEFKARGTVAPAVLLGSTHIVQIDENGRASALWIDGQWSSITNSSRAWQYGTLGELIYERDGVIFWIVGDQRDGIDSRTLLKIAQSLHPISADTMFRMSRVSNVVFAGESGIWPFSGHVVFTENHDGPIWMIVPGDQITSLARGGPRAFP